MLCNEYGVPFHRRLFAIIFGKSRGQSGRDEIEGVEPDGVDAFGVDVLAVLVCQFEPGAEFGFFEGDEGFGDFVGHKDSVFGVAGLCAMDNIANDNRMFSEGC